MEKIGRIKKRVQEMTANEIRASEMIISNMACADMYRHEITEIRMR